MLFAKIKDAFNLKKHIGRINLSIFISVVLQVISAIIVFAKLKSAILDDKVVLVCLCVIGTLILAQLIMVIIKVNIKE